MKNILTLVALILLLTPALAAADGTAKSGLAQAIQLGKAWQPDAVLTAIGTPGADANGKSRLWQYDLYSKKNQGVRPGQSPEGPGALPPQVSLLCPGKNHIDRVRGQYRSDHDFDRAKAVTRGWGVDPKTGKFLKRLSGER